jgi:hypothetical protein
LNVGTIHFFKSKRATFFEVKIQFARKKEKIKNKNKRATSANES